MLNFRLGIFLGWRQIKRSNIWTSILVVVVVVFTVINLVVVSGILKGITDGVLRTVQHEALGDIIIDPLPEHSRIRDTERLLRELDLYKEIAAFTAHYEGLATIEANYSERRDLSLDRDVIAVNVYGIDPVREDETLHLSSIVTEGEYFTPDDRGYVLIGKHYVDRYADAYGNVFDSLRNIKPGSVVRISTGTESREFTVKGIVDSKIDMVSLNVYIPERDFRRMFDRADYDAAQILVSLKPGVSDLEIQEQLIRNGFADVAQVDLFRTSIPKYILDVINTFGLLSTAIGAISIFVASITVFIIIFINTISRRRQIGILKAIGIRKRVLEYSYATQAALYGLIGVSIALVIIYSILIPYFVQHPIDFPYSDVELSVPPLKLMVECTLLMSMMIIAGFFPAWIVVKQNTLDAILGRK
jgi:putative ABC transport system permease protein